MANGQSLTTQTGKAEVLLTPGVVLRVADNSAVKMISADLANTQVELDMGRALVEVSDIHKENNIRIDENGVSTKLLQKGLYDFDAAHNQVRVFQGKAEVYTDKKLTVTAGHEVTLNSTGKLRRKASTPGSMKTTSIAGPACVPDICRKPTSTRHAPTLAAVPAG